MTRSIIRTVAAFHKRIGVPNQKRYSKVKIPMLGAKSVIDHSIPPVDPFDLHSLWILQSQHAGDGATISFSAKAILSICKAQTADPVAIWARATLLRMFLMNGLLEEWRVGNDVQKIVFDALAVFPLPNGLQAAEPYKFIAALSA